MSKSVVIWLDDERKVPKNILSLGMDVLVVKDYESCIWQLQLSEVLGHKIYMCFDHDLGRGKNGYDVAKWIVENQYPLEGFEIHSMNPVGRRNISQLLTHYGYKKIGK